MLGRRNFLQGVISAAAITTTSLVVKARPEEIAAFGKPLHDLPVVVHGSEEVIGEQPEGMGPEYLHDVLYNRNGTAVAIVREINLYNDIHEMISYDGRIERVPGMRHGELRADLLAPFVFGRPVKVRSEYGPRHHKRQSILPTS